MILRSKATLKDKLFLDMFIALVPLCLPFPSYCVAGAQEAAEACLLFPFLNYGCVRSWIRQTSLLSGMGPQNTLRSLIVTYR